MDKEGRKYHEAQTLGFLGLTKASSNNNHSGAAGDITT